jgi:uncharacterized protein
LRLLFVTDIHESKNALGWLLRSARGYDSIAIGGDLTTEGRLPFVDELLHSLQRIKTKVILVQGNHDPIHMARVPRITCLHGTKVAVNSFTVGGLGGSNFTGTGAPFEYSDEEARKLLGRIGQVDIMISHCPPFGTKCDFAPDGRHYGSLPVREYVESTKPRLVLCGHVHVARAVDNMGETTVINPGPLIEGNYAVVEISNYNLSVQLMQSPVITSNTQR